MPRRRDVGGWCSANSPRRRGAARAGGRPGARGTGRADRAGGRTRKRDGNHRGREVRGRREDKAQCSAACACPCPEAVRGHGPPQPHSAPADHSAGRTCFIPAKVRWAASAPHPASLAAEDTPRPDRAAGIGSGVLSWSPWALIKFFIAFIFDSSGDRRGFRARGLRGLRHEPFNWLPALNPPCGPRFPLPGPGQGLGFISVAGSKPLIWPTAPPVPLARSGLPLLLPGASPRPCAPPFQGGSRGAKRGRGGKTCSARHRAISPS